MDLYLLTPKKMVRMILGLSLVFTTISQRRTKLLHYSVSFKLFFFWRKQNTGKKGETWKVIQWFIELYINTTRSNIDIGSNVVVYPEAAVRALEAGHTLCAQ